MSFREYMQGAMGADRQVAKAVRPVVLRGLTPEPIGQAGIKIVRRKAVFRDRELAALFEWTADQIAIATPTAVIHTLDSGFVWSREHEDEVPIHTVLPAKLQSAYTRWWGMLDRVAPVEWWHAAIEPGEMTFLPPEPWREVRS